MRLGLALATLSLALPAFAQENGLDDLVGQEAGIVPVSYIENLGQWDAQARFLYRRAGMDLWITDTGAVYDLYRLRRDQAQSRDETFSKRGHRVRVEFFGARSGTSKGIGALPGDYNYLIGDRSENWTTGVKAYREAVVRDLYPGIDARWYADSGSPRYDLIVRPGSDPSQISLKVIGAQSLRTDGTTLRIGTTLGALEQRGLFAYQENGPSARQVPCRMKVVGDTVRFEVGDYDPFKPLVLDPLIWSSVLGGGSDDFGHAVTVDASGRPIIAGSTLSSLFPVTVGAYDTAFVGGSEAFVARFSQDGATLQFCTFLGGGNDDRIRGIDLDSSNRPIVVGNTSSSNFPTTAGAIDSTYNGMYDAFIAKLSVNGASLVFSTFLGGASDDFARCIKQDSAGRLHIAGYTESAAFPATVGAFDTTFNGMRDGFLMKLSATATTLLFSTFVGGDSQDMPFGLALDSTGRAVIAGETGSSSFPTRPGSFDRIYGGNDDAFVTKFNTAGTGLVFSTFIGGQGYDYARGLVIDGNDNPIIVGQTFSSDYPTTAGVLDTTYNGNSDGIVTKLSVNGSALSYSTFIGGQNSDEAISVVIDETGRPTFCGQTDSSDFPVKAGGHDTTFNGTTDAFLVKLTPTATSVFYGTFFGGFGIDIGLDIAQDQYDRVFMSGQTASGDFPTTSGVFDPTFNGSVDAFLALFTPGPISAKADTYSTPVGVTLDVPAPGVMANDSFAGGATAQLTQSPTKAAGFTFRADGSFTYVPLNNFQGTDTFKYRLISGSIVTDPKSVTINIQGLPQGAEGGG